MEEELKDKINELSHFKEMVLWWEKRISEMQREMDIIKTELVKHNQDS